MGKLLSVKINNIDKVLKHLDSYEKILPYLCQSFVEKLADVGIKVGIANSGQYKDYIIFSLENLEKSKYGCKGILVAKDLQQITREWEVKDGIHEETISPILMAEFGSGWLSDTAWETWIAGVGQGTLDKYGHANDPRGWYWKDESGITHHSIGEQPSYPVYMAYIEMEKQIKKIAKEVFAK